MSSGIFCCRSTVCNSLSATAESPHSDTFIENAILHGITAVLRFWALLGGSGATYDVYLRLIGKRVVEFLLVLTALFCYRYYPGVTAEALRANIDWKSAISLQRGQPANHYSSQITRLNDLSCGIKIWTDLSSYLSQCTHLTDGQRDRLTDTFLVVSMHSMQRGEKLKQTCVPHSQWYFYAARHVESLL